LTQRDPRRELRQAQQVFAALSHPSRRQILLVIQFHGGRMSAGEIARRFACSWPTTTRHLRQLERAGLLGVTKRGRERVYQLETPHLRGVVEGWLRWFSREAGV